MKKILALVLTLVLLTASVGVLAEEMPLSGGWSVNTTTSALKLDKLAKQALKKATKDYVGMSLTPLALLGEQVVAGMNYCYLAYSSTATYPPVNNLCKVYVYQDLAGKAELTKIKTLKLKHAPSGGWVLSPTQKAAKVESQAKKALKKATGTLVGADYKPLLVLARGSKEGTAWCLLCSKQVVVPGSSASLCLVYVKKSGKSYKISGINDLTLAR